LVSLELSALTHDQARELLGESADAVYEESGGNPFYLEQLARALGRTGHVPRGIAEALAEELAILPERSRGVLQGAAVAGDPFEPDLAAVAAGVAQADALGARDELLRLALARPTDVPRRFRFRHPLLRRAVYESAPGGWLLGAHERCAAALAERGAAATARAMHVERCARQGDGAAVAVLRAAGEASSQRAPASAAHWYDAALRLSTDDGERVGLLLAGGGAVAASGQRAAARDAIVESLQLVRDDAMRLRLVAACAAIERVLGRHEDGRARLRAALDQLPDPRSAEAAGVMLELGADGFARSDADALRKWPPRALELSRELGDPVLIAATAALATVPDLITG